MSPTSNSSGSSPGVTRRRSWNGSSFNRTLSTRSDKSNSSSPQTYKVLRTTSFPPRSAFQKSAAGDDDGLTNVTTVEPGELLRSIVHTDAAKRKTSSPLQSPSRVFPALKELKATEVPKRVTVLQENVTTVDPTEDLKSADLSSPQSSEQRTPTLSSASSKDISTSLVSSPELSPTNISNSTDDMVVSPTRTFIRQNLAHRNKATAAWVAESLANQPTSQEERQQNSTMEESPSHRLSDRSDNGMHDQSLLEPDHIFEDSEKPVHEGISNPSNSAGKGEDMASDMDIDEAEQMSETYRPDAFHLEYLERRVLELEVDNNFLTAEVESLRKAKTEELTREQREDLMSQTKASTPANKWQPVRAPDSADPNESKFLDLPSKWNEVRIRMAISTSQLALMRRTSEANERARESATLALELAEDLQYDELIGKASYYLGEVELAEKQLDEAKRLFQAAEKKCPELRESFKAVEQLKILEGLMRASSELSEEAKTSSANMGDDDAASDGGNPWHIKTLAEELGNLSEGIESPMEQTPTVETPLSPQDNTATAESQQRKPPAPLKIQTQFTAQDTKSKPISSVPSVSADTTTLHAPIPQRKTSLPFQHLTTPTSRPTTPIPSTSPHSAHPTTPNAKKVHIDETSGRTSTPSAKSSSNDSNSSKTPTSPTHPHNSRRRKSKIYDEEAQQSLEEEEEFEDAVSEQVRERLGVGDEEALSPVRAQRWWRWGGW